MKLPPLLTIKKNIPLFVNSIVRKHYHKFHHKIHLTHEDIDRTIFHNNDLFDISELIEISKEEFKKYGVKVEKGENCIIARRFYDFELDKYKNNV